MSVSDLERDRADRVVIESYPEVGYNFRLSDLHAAVGLAQLEKLDRFLERRRALASRYDAALAGMRGLALPEVPDYAEPNYQSYIVRLVGAPEATRNRLLDALHARGVASRRGLMAVHLEAPYRGAKRAGSLHHTEAAASQTFLLPLYPDLSDAQQDRVIEELRAALAELP
jgi:dTDP-4-amino-4,6-dideoxygalactose transaminase